ncbi:MAG: sodium-dependent transporter [Firmicutes bacterium]|nr:sodium-dependent transporter [Bacillota bacterium]
MKHQNGSFSSSFAFILASVGSAVGLGNIWLFPYRLGQYGGAAFLIPYLFFIVLFGAVGLSAEFAIGRKARTGTLGSYALCWEEKGKAGRVGKAMGWIPLLGSMGIAIGYSIIIGWVLRSLGGVATGALMETESSVYFSQATGTLGSFPWHIAVILVTMLLLITGSASHIEKANKILMPVFFILFAALAIRVAFLPQAVEGYRFLFVPRWELLGQVDTWVMAMGQAFFSLSITGSGMIVYGSYLSRKEDILRSSLCTAGFDTIAALLAALAIMPAVFSFGIEPGAGPSLMFITIPKIFQQMFMGRFFAGIFFLSVSFAGITSLMNMFEAVIESWQHRFHLERKKAVCLACGICLAVGLLLEEEAKVGNWMDFVTIIIVPFGAVFGAISIYYVLGIDKIMEELRQGRKRPMPNWFGFVAKYIYVPLTIVVFVLGLIYKGIG